MPLHKAERLRAVLHQRRLRRHPRLHLRVEPPSTPRRDAAVAGSAVGAPATLEMHLSEYKAVNGIKLPHLITRWHQRRDRRRVGHQELPD
jgi:hypothetical protein